jgi:predicted lipid-binding transport protein (Tim44 family)
LAIGAIGVAGIVEWPILLAVGGGALLLRRMSQKPEEARSPAKAKLTPVPTKAAPEKAAPQKAPAKAAAKKTAGRRAGAADLRSTN